MVKDGVLVIVILQLLIIGLILFKQNLYIIIAFISLILSLSTFFMNSPLSIIINVCTILYCSVIIYKQRKMRKELEEQIKKLNKLNNK